MSTFEESPLTGPLPPGSLPEQPPLVPRQAVAPAVAPARSEPRPEPEDAAPSGEGVSLARPGRPAPPVDVAPAPEVSIATDPDATEPDVTDPDVTDPEPFEADRGVLEEAPAQSPVPATGRSRRLLTRVLAGVLVLAVVLAGALVYERRVQAQDQAQDAARNQAVAVVRLAAPLLLSYDYRTLAADFAAALAYTDGDFKKQYQQTTSTVVSPVAVQYKAVVRAQLVELGVTSATADRVVVVAFVNQVTTSTRVTGTKLDQSRVRFELHRVGSGWKIVLVAAL